MLSNICIVVKHRKSSMNVQIIWLGWLGLVFPLTRQAPSLQCYEIKLQRIFKISQKIHNPKVNYYRMTNKAEESFIDQTLVRHHFCNVIDWKTYCFLLLDVFKNPQGNYPNCVCVLCCCFSHLKGTIDPKSFDGFSRIPFSKHAKQ